jgi:error-prone DNA polymerase
VREAARRGLLGLALTDDDGLYGVVKAHLAAKELGLRFLVGARLTLTDGPPVALYAQSAQGYANLCRLLSQSRLTHEKGQAGLAYLELAERAQGLVLLLPFPPAAESTPAVEALADAFHGRFYVGLFRACFAGDEARVRAAVALSRRLGAPLLAHNDVHTHARARQRLQDVMTAIRHATTVDALGERGFPNAERTLKSPQEMAALFDDFPDAVARSVEVLERCQYSLDELRYQFPQELLPKGHTPDSHLRALTEAGLSGRYPTGIPAAVTRQVEHELSLIQALDFAGYFLAIHDLVTFARSREILCQGRGSAANSAVCYALGITAIDPVRMDLLFERFISMERKEPPDIDVDFEHERREEVLQYVYEKHGRHRAAMVAAVVCYQGRLALREVGKALGLSLDQVDRLAKNVGHGLDEGTGAAQLAETGLVAEDAAVRLTLELAHELVGFPRHLSIHSGGFVITHTPLVELVPIENAAMPGRTVVQWDKDDCAALNLLKVDLLSLGMLTALHKTLDLVKAHHGVEHSLATLPAEDPTTYEMISRGDTLGVFQIESRAQIQMLPRLQPRTFYDLVIEVAIIRPGPIIGDMVHPFLRRRNGTEPVTYPSKEVEAILGRTLGVPLFQEQAMKLAMAVAGFTPNEADGLRRAISHRQAEERMVPYLHRFVEGAVARGYPEDFAKTCFQRFKGFSAYGFPESHAASFALLSYASSYLKCHYPAAFTTALLNSQPMGFYAPHTLVEDVRRHGVTVLPVDVRRSSWDCTLEDGALRLGLRLVKGLERDLAKRVEKAQRQGFDTLGELARAGRLPRHALARLALAGALFAFGERRQVLWQVEALSAFDEDDLFFGESPAEPHAPLRELTGTERVVMDYQAMHLSLEQHPLGLLRPSLAKHGALTAKELNAAKRGRVARVGGMAICRQRPPTAKGMAFLSLEDETGIANVVVTPDLFERHRAQILGSLFLYVEGVVERSGNVRNLKAQRVAGLRLPEG